MLPAALETYTTIIIYTYACLGYLDVSAQTSSVRLEGRICVNRTTFLSLGKKTFLIVPSVHMDGLPLPERPVLYLLANETVCAGIMLVGIPAQREVWFCCQTIVINIFTISAQKEGILAKRCKLEAE